MGTRLYIDTEDVATVVAVLGLPEETLGQFQEWREQSKNLSYEEAFNLQNEEVAYLDNFLLFGWGKLSGEAWDILGGWSDYGEVTDPDMVQKILMAMGDRVDPLVRRRIGEMGLGLCWS